MSEALFLYERRLSEAHAKVVALGTHDDLLPAAFDEDYDAARRIGDAITDAEASLRHAFELVKEEADLRRSVTEIGQ